jgi:hemerythrin superfamily protein
MASKDIFERLKLDHDKHRELIREIEETTGDSGERKALYEQFRVDAKAHASAEEVTLYATLMAEIEMREYARHAAADHHEIDDAIKEVDETDMSSSGWLAKFKKLKETFLDHLKEEEETIFPDAKKDLGEERSVELLAAFNAIKPEEIERVESGADDKIAEKIG